MLQTKNCLSCGDQIKGRSDKKFCSDQCRNNFHNQENQKNEYIKQVNAILKKNRRILESLNPDGKAKVSKERLLTLGFQFKYYTNVYKTSTGNIYYFCYEHGYLPLENDLYALVIKKEYVI